MIHARTLESLEFQKILKYISNFCVTAAGKAMALGITPLQSPEEANHFFALYKESRIFFFHPQKNQGKPFCLKPFPEVSPLFEKDISPISSHGSCILNLENLWAIREMLDTGNEALACLQIPEAETLWPELLQFFSDTHFPLEFHAALKRCISDDGGINDESSPELYHIRNDIRNISRNCRTKIKDFTRQYNIQFLLQDEFLTLANDRYVLPLKANFKGKIQGIIHDWSQTGETCYFEPVFLVEINNKLQELKHLEREEEKRILNYLEGLFYSSFSSLKKILILLATLDLLKAEALMADELGCECLSFTAFEDGCALYQARHPLLLIARKPLSAGFSRSQVCPVDLVLKRGDKSLIITGGNAGGKTVCLKTFGLLAVMAASGLPVPAAKGSYLPWFEHIDTFIGDEQSLADNVSTFTAQIGHFVSARKHFEQKALVLLDEFGTGTDPAEGSAIAQAVMDDLLEKNCFVLSATHFPALKNYALTKQGVRAATMLFDPVTGKPIYQIAYDQVGASRALAIARDQGLPEKILSRAQHYLLQGGEATSSVLDQLNELCLTREHELAELKEKQHKYEDMLKSQKEKLEKEKLLLREKISAQINAIRSAHQENRLSAKNALREMNNIRHSLLAAEETNDPVLPSAGLLLPGTEVFHSLFQKKGTVTEIDTRKNRARLDMNGMHIWADNKFLKPAPSSHAEIKKISPLPEKNNASAPLTFTIDLRGCRVTEALAQLEKTLDKIMLEGFGEIDIIHGRGTGVLRKEIHSFLEVSPHIKTFSTASEDTGGDGVTIACLK